MLEITLDHFFKGAISKAFKKNLDRRATEFCRKNVVKIQAQARGFHFRHMYQKQKEELARQAKIATDQAKSIHIQCLARRYLARKAVLKIAMRSYVKYVDPSTDDPYWSNPKTKSVTWAKPKIFGKVRQGVTRSEATMRHRSRSSHVSLLLLFLALRTL